MLTRQVIFFFVSVNGLVIQHSTLCMAKIEIMHKQHTIVLTKIHVDTVTTVEGIKSKISSYMYICVCVISEINVLYLFSIPICIIILLDMNSTSSDHVHVHSNDIKLILLWFDHQHQFECDECLEANCCFWSRLRWEASVPCAVWLLK